jgi:tRNA A37 threonylcarbamoyladenosine dehydratase
MENIHSRTLALIGEEAMTKLHGARVAVFGLGGVGSYIAEALALAGVGSLLRIDGDEIAPSTLNRQQFATADTVGMR